MIRRLATTCLFLFIAFLAPAAAGETFTPAPASSVEGVAPGADGVVIRWMVLPGESRVGFLLDTVWHDVEGETAAIEASLESASGDIFSDGRVVVKVAAASLETGNRKRDRKMREEFLETGSHPFIEFRSTAPPQEAGADENSEGGPAGVRHLKITGDLTIHGVTRPVELIVNVEEREGGWIMSGEVTVSLQAHGIADPSVFLNKVKDELTIEFRLVFLSGP